MLEIGIIASILILFSWIYETVESLREEKGLADLKFCLIYLIGVILLVVYSFYINDIVYIWLNSLITIFVLTETVYIIYKSKR